MGLPQWQLRGEVVSVDKVASVDESLSAPKPVAVAAKPVAPAAPVTNEPETTVKTVIDEPEPIKPSVVVSPAEPTSDTAPAVVDMKVVPLLVVWDELQEQAVAGAGSFPSGELGDLLANIVIAVGLTEDVVEAWSTPPDDIQAQLLAKNLAPRSIWSFSPGQVAHHQSVQVNGVKHNIEMISAPSLRELQLQKPLKAQLWRLLKPLVDAGVWR